VDDWNPNKTFRAIALTELGKEYNLSHYKERDYLYAKALKKENEDYRVTNDAINDYNMKLEDEKQKLEMKNETLSRQLRSDELLNDASIDAITRTKKLEERCLFYYNIFK
jgi:hypothetical protein